MCVCVCADHKLGEGALLGERLLLDASEWCDVDPSMHHPPDQGSTYKGYHHFSNTPVTLNLPPLNPTITEKYLAEQDDCRLLSALNKASTASSSAAAPAMAMV